jgi:hypothetical protein
VINSSDRIVPSRLTVVLILCFGAKVGSRRLVPEDAGVYVESGTAR